MASQSCGGVHALSDIYNATHVPDRSCVADQWVTSASQREGVAAGGRDALLGRAGQAARTLFVHCGVSRPQCPRLKLFKYSNEGLGRRRVPALGRRNEINEYIAALRPTTH